MRRTQRSLLALAALLGLLGLPTRVRADDDFPNTAPLHPVPAEPTPLRNVMPEPVGSAAPPPSSDAPFGTHVRGGVTGNLLLRSSTFPFPVLRVIGALGAQFDDRLGLEVLARFGVDFLPYLGASVLFTVAPAPAFELAAGPTYEAGLIDVSRLLGSVRGRFRPSRISSPRARGGFVLDLWAELGGTHGCWGIECLGTVSTASRPYFEFSYEAGFGLGYGWF